MRRPRTSNGPYSQAPELVRSVGERIRQLRVDWNWTQARLAKALNTDQRTVSQWERGIHAPSGAALGSLVWLTGVSPEVWTSGDGFRTPDPPQIDPGQLMEANRRGLAVILNPAPSGQIGLVDLEDEFSPEHVDIKAAQELLAKAYREDRAVWIVQSSG